jgi:hypothetical protein
MDAAAAATSGHPRRSADRELDPTERDRSKKNHDDDKDDSNGKRRSQKRHKQHKHSRKAASKHKRPRDYSSNDDSNNDDASVSESSNSSSSESRERRRRKSKKRKKERKHRRDDSCSDHEEESKRKKSHKRKRRRSNSPSSSSRRASATATFGQYGILKASDMPRVQRAFEAWMTEVQGIPMLGGGSGSALPKWELQQYQETFREDYNTATLPHTKYYNYDQWEMDEYQKQQAQQQKGHKDSAGVNVHADERAHAQQRRLKAQQAEEAQLRQTMATMSRDQVSDMVHQEQLRVQMQLAFARGDQALYKRLKDKLTPLEEDQKGKPRAR